MAEPKFLHKVEFENVTLYHADCLDVLPLLPKVDALITDPPYGIFACGKVIEERCKHGTILFFRNRCECGKYR